MEKQFITVEDCTAAASVSNSYTVIRELGRGAFGETFLVSKTGSDTPFVMKRLRIKPGSPGSPSKSMPMTPTTPITPTTPTTPIKTQAIDLREIFFEINILKKIAKSGCRPDILCFHEYFIDCEQQTVNIVTFAFTNAISLSEYIISYQKLKTFVSKTALLQIMYNIADALAYLTKIGIAHGDIKPDNILINPDTLDIQIIDFGLACSKHCKPSGTLLFASPEVLHDLFIAKRISLDELQQGDVFSLGIVFYLLANLTLPYPTRGAHKFKYSESDSDDSIGSESDDLINSIQLSEPNVVSYNPIELSDRMVMRAQLERFYKTQQNRIISMYNNNATDVDVAINGLIESMMRLDTKTARGRPSMKRVLSTVKRIIVDFNQSLRELGLSQKKSVHIKAIAPTVSSPL